ncbi:MAG: lipocalin family protein [Bacteroidota bacterium]
MNELTKRLLTLLVIIFSIILFTNCDDDGPTDPPPGLDSDLVGEWELIEAFIPSMNLTVTAEQAGLAITATFSADGNYEQVLTDSSGTLTETGTWSTSNGVLTLTDSADDSEEEMEYSVSDDGNTGILKSTYEVQPGMELPAEFKFEKVD